MEKTKTRIIKTRAIGPNAFFKEIDFRRFNGHSLNSINTRNNKRAIGTVINPLLNPVCGRKNKAATNKTNENMRTNPLNANATPRTTGINIDKYAPKDKGSLKVELMSDS